MKDLNARNVPPTLVFFAFFITLFMFFTPFEQSGSDRSMLPKYLSAGVSILMIMPLIAIRKVALNRSSVMVLMVMFTLVFHTVVINPVPGQFVLLIFANLFLAVLLYEASFTWRPQFVSAVCWILNLNALVIAVQALLFYTLNQMVDFHKLIFGSNSRFVEDYLNIARFSGLQVEPGTYANYIACLMAILLLSAEFRARIFLTAGVSLVSIFLTNSGSSIYFVPLMTVLLVYLWRNKIKPVHVLTLGAAMFTYLYFSGILAHLESRFFEHDDGSLSHRMDGINAYLALSLEQKFIGVGFGSDPCVRCYYQDIGVTFNLLTRGGALVALAMLPLLIRSVAVNGLALATILFLIPLNEKMYFYEAPIWLLILLATSGVRQMRTVRKAQPHGAPLQLTPLGRPS